MLSDPKDAKDAARRMPIACVVLAGQTMPSLHLWVCASPQFHSCCSGKIS